MGEDTSMNRTALIGLLKNHGIDGETSFRILDRYNLGNLPALPTPDPILPGFDGNRVVDRAALPRRTLTQLQVLSALDGMGISHESVARWLKTKQSPIDFGPAEYAELGMLLLPWVSIGILNGGLATSYCDRKKNESANPEVFHSLKEIFGSRGEELRGLPKGLAPAYYNLDGSAGYSFLYLRIRQALLMALGYQNFLKSRGLPEPETDPLFPFFQMTSDGTNLQLSRGIEELQFRNDLSRLANKARVTLTPWLTAVQPLLAAFTHEHVGNPKKLFLGAWGKEQTPLGLPGGHGQNFSVLSGIYNALLNRGKRFVYLGNVDNLGSLPDPGSLGYLALHGGEGAFDFSFKTAVDLKGGVLIRTLEGGLTCADIGPSVKEEVVEQAVLQGQPVLFNCATGLFRLDTLVKELSWINDSLPVRFSNQVKDAGSYSQAEQVTWEVIGLLKNPVILGVDKYKRFLAAKMLVDTFMTSGLVDDGTNLVAEKLYQGMKYLLVHEYGLVDRDGVWVPDTPKTWEEKSL